MPLPRRATEPGEARGGILRHAVPVEEQLSVQRLRIGIAILRERQKEGRALPGSFRDARGRIGQRGGGRTVQNLNSTVPNTVRPDAIAA